jgi:hypothetical protein
MCESEQNESLRERKKKERWEFGMLSTACEQQQRRQESTREKREKKHFNE